MQSCFLVSFLWVSILFGLVFSLGFVFFGFVFFGLVFCLVSILFGFCFVWLVFCLGFGLVFSLG